MPVGAAPAKAKLDFSAGREAPQSRSRVGDQRPRIVAAPAKRRRRRLGADQPHHASVGELERLAVLDRSDGRRLMRRQITGGGKKQIGEAGRDQEDRSQQP